MRATKSGRRPGVTYLEIQVAFAATGIALAGLAPLAVAQLRLMARAEARIYCLFPAEYALEEDPLDPQALALHRASVPADEILWRRTLGASSSGSAGATAGWTLRAIDVPDRGPSARSLRLDGPSGARWVARRGPQAGGLSWDDDGSGAVQTPGAFYSRPIARSGPFAAVALVEDEGEWTDDGRAMPRAIVTP